MSSQTLPWQADRWLQVMQMRERFPHALLLHGPQGIGKTLFAEQLAQALLCEAPLPDGHACGQCLACGWFAQYAHPDYRRGGPQKPGEGAAPGEGGAGSAKGGEGRKKA